MVFISQPSTVPDINDLANEYVYDSSSGSGQFVYSLDYGAALPNPVSLVYTPTCHILTVF